jgi:hypothetical protein
LHRDIFKPCLSIEIQPPPNQSGLSVATGASRAVVEVVNTGNVPLLADGPASATLTTRLRNKDGETTRAVPTRLPEPVLPGQALRVPLEVEPTKQAGDYTLEVELSGAALESARAMSRSATVTDTAPALPSSFDSIRSALSEAEIAAELPAGYADVSEGALAVWKHKIKRKLLHQFQTAYVDVLSRQQTAFNRAVLAVVQELVESNAMLERSLVYDSAEPAPPGNLEEQVRLLGAGVSETTARLIDLEQRLSRLLARLEEPAATLAVDGSR